MHGDAVGAGVESGDEGYHLDGGILPQQVQRPGAVLAAAPGKCCFDQRTLLADAATGWAARTQWAPSVFSPKVQPWRTSASSSAVRKIVIPERLNSMLPSAKMRLPLRTARSSCQNGSCSRQACSRSVRCRSKPHGATMMYSGSASRSASAGMAVED